ncbi:hypothetical protein IC006_2144 [Sulfuracidifex tepidarius]|uniref:Uncharacterized protein n=1 Tax=Sulfuracidifex tepidarius TaxID=1294262 RepID=A0A510DXW0_9CREN|nr:hypothetical protein [Sulfuracidifex tepidarius]BBG24810.1 hypothetical protein IC006_2144 [Sulfuracidifex tepidarius]
MIDPLNCDVFKRLTDGRLMIEVQGIRIFLKEEQTFGMVRDLTLKSTNYNLMCRIVFDERKEKVIIVSCKGFKSDIVKAMIEESMKRSGLLYVS